MNGESLESDMCKLDARCARIKSKPPEKHEFSEKVLSDTSDASAGSLNNGKTQ